MASKFYKFLFLVWFLIALDPKSFYAPLAPEKGLPIFGKFDSHLECDAMAALLRISRPDWLISCVYTMYDNKVSPQDRK